MAHYNNVGHRIDVDDPNRGIWRYEYNGFGELKTQYDARALNPVLNSALALNQSFDVLGRLISRNGSKPPEEQPTGQAFIAKF